MSKPNGHVLGDSCHSTLLSFFTAFWPFFSWGTAVLTSFDQLNMVVAQKSKPSEPLSLSEPKDSCGVRKQPVHIFDVQDADAVPPKSAAQLAVGKNLRSYGRFWGWLPR